MSLHSEGGKHGSKTFWKRYRTDKKFRNTLLNKWREARIRNYEKSSKYLPKISKKEFEISKSRLCGFLAADGSVFIRKERETGKVHYEIKFYPDDEVLVKIFIETFRRIYGKAILAKNNGKYFKISVSNKFAVMDLLSIADFSSKNWTLPKILRLKESKKEWLRAYFDCDGYVAKKYIQLQSVNKNGLKQIKKLLMEFDITSRMYSYKRRQKSWNINYMLNINKRDILVKFQKEIGFNHTRKKEKLQKLIDAGVA